MIQRVDCGSERDLFLSPLDGLLILDAESLRVVEVNRALLRLIDRHRDDVLGVSVADLLAAPSTEAIERVAQHPGPDSRCRAGGRLMQACGGHLDVQVSVEAVETTEGVRVVLACSPHDPEEVDVATVTDALSRYRRLTETDNTMVYRMRLPDGVYEYVSAGCKRVYGVSESVFLAQPLEVAKLIHPDSVAYFQEAWGRLLEGDMPPTYEYSIVRPDGERRYLRQNNVLIRDEDGRPAAIEGLVFDVTEQALEDVERSQLLQSLEDERERLSAVFNGIDDVMYVSDMDTYEILHLNDAGLATWGADAVGQKCYKVLQGQDAPCSFCTNDLIRGELLGQTYLWENQSGANGRWYRHSNKAISWMDGRLVRFELATDITPLKELQSELTEALERVRTSNRDLEHFAYVASHDLQEPLRMVASFTRLLGERYRDVLDETGREYVDYAVDGASRMQQLINALLTYSRVDTQGGDFADFSLADAVGDVLRSLRLQIEDAEATVEVGVLPEVQADRVQVADLIQNLISNAIKFRGEAPPAIRVGAERDESGRVVVSVADNGIGIDSADHARVFEIFGRLHGRDDCPGTGLGLAVAQRIVQRHGGRIWVESIPGEGSTFFFTLPPAAAESNAARADSSPA